MSRIHPRGLVSVVIPALNEASTITRAIAPFLVDPAQFRVEVIVADGGSADGTQGVVRELAARDSRVRLVENPARITSIGLNAAIKASGGDVIVRMDGHAEPAVDYLAAALAALASSGA